MSDSSDLDSMGELVEALEEMKAYDCGNCPLHYPNMSIANECSQIYESLLAASYSNCKEVCLRGALKMSDSSDLEEMSELIEAIREVDYGDCDNCPLFYNNYTSIGDECDWMVQENDTGDTDCEYIRAKKIDEMVRYIFERSLRE